MRIGWHWREPKGDREAEDVGDFLARLTGEVEGIDSGLRHVGSLPLAQAVDAAWTPEGLSRDDLAIRIGAQRGMGPAQALTVLRLGD